MSGLADASDVQQPGQLLERNIIWKLVLRVFPLDVRAEPPATPRWPCQKISLGNLGESVVVLYYLMEAGCPLHGQR